MTEPKHIPLPKRFTDAALERLAAWLITPLEAADDAHDVIGDAPEVCGNGCECWVTPEHMWLSAASCGYGGGYEPGSQVEFNPDCPKHGTAADDAHVALDEEED